MDDGRAAMSQAAEWIDNPEDLLIFRLLDRIQGLHGALWQCAVWSGMDTDGETGPAAFLAGMGEAGFATMVVEEVRDLRKNYDEALRETT